MTNKEKEAPHFYGGQAVMEGVMMRGKSLYAMAVRKPSGEIAVVSRPISDPSKKYFWLKWPIIRGIVGFCAALAIGMKTLTESAEIATEGEEEELTRFERFLQDKFGNKVNDILVQVSVVLAVAIAVTLFILLPLWIGGGVTSVFAIDPSFLGVVEGLARLMIFLLYVLVISRSKDIRRVFQYHGAEHKTLNGFENNAELTVESVRGFSRLHNRCGTSFLLIVMFISIVVFAFVRTPDPIMRLVSRLVLIPVVAGISYEVIRWAGRSKSMWVKVVSFPGLCLQRLTTGEPDDKQIEVAITALKAVFEAEGQPVSDANRLGEVEGQPVSGANRLGEAEGQLVSDANRLGEAEGQLVSGANRLGEELSGEEVVADDNQ